ncbi:ornithine/putrescine carbamoyltransferase, partial [Kipferlia bialata]|eukprot:g8642.t1
MPTRHLKTISSLSPEEFVQIIDLSIAIKTNPEKYTTALANKTLLAIFAKPSLRTRVSLETAMTKLGGHTIYYQLGAGAPLGVKETYGDTGGVISRMVDACSARVYSRNEINELSDACTIPVINALDDWGHPLQMVCDFITIKEKFGGFKTAEGTPLHFMYAGDSLNNVTYDLMRACSLVGMHCHVACPDNK